MIAATQAAADASIEAADIIIERINRAYLPYNWTPHVAMMGWGLLVDIAGHQQRERLFVAALEVRRDHPFIV